MSATYPNDNPRTPLAVVLAVVMHVLLAALLVVYFWVRRPPVLASSDHVFELVSTSPAAEPAASAPAQSAPAVHMPTLPPPPHAAPVTPKSTTPPLPVTQVPTPIAATQQPTSKPETYADFLKQHQLPTTTTTSTSHPQPARPVPHVGVDSTAIENSLKAMANSPNPSAQSGQPSSAAKSDYIAGLEERLKAAYEKPPTLVDQGLSTVVDITIAADGQVLSCRVVRASGDAQFDAAVSAAIQRVTVVDPPPNGQETFRLTWNVAD